MSPLRTIGAKLFRAKWMVFVFLAVTLIGWFVVVREDPPPAYETTEAALGDVIQEVSVTGRVEADTEADLSFERSGRIASVSTVVGGRVSQGAVIARLDATDLNAELAQSIANIAAAESELLELRRGTREEDVRVSEARLQSAQVSLEDTALALRDSISDGKLKFNEALFTKTDGLLKNPRSNDPQLNIPVTDFRLENEIELHRLALSERMRLWPVVEEDLSASVARLKSDLSELREYLDHLADAVSGIVVSSVASQTQIDLWKTDVSSARSLVATAQSALLSAEERFRGAESALAIAENELALKRAGVLPEAIAAQEARVRALQAGADALRAQINKTVLRSPIAGVVTKNDLRAGETVAPNVPLVRIQADTDYQIEANIPEVDIAKVSIGDEARVTLDAFGSDTVFQAKVSQVDPAETVIEGVPTYKVTLRFVSGEEVVKTGMTANIDIRTDERDAVVVIPSRAVGTEDGSKIVRILPPGAVTPTERVVTLGLRGSDGRVEVLTGVDVGDRIVTFDPGE